MKPVSLLSRSPRAARKITDVGTTSLSQRPPLLHQQSSRFAKWTRTRIRAVLPFLCVLVVLSLLHGLFENSIMSSVDLATSSDKKAIHTTTTSDSVPSSTKQETISTPDPTLTPTLQPVTSSFRGSSNTTKVASSGHSFFETPILTNQSHAFVDRWCDLQNTEWYTQKRTPHFLIPGAKYTGTRELAQWLMSIAPTSIQPPRRSLELSFFLDGPFAKYVYKKTEKTAVHAARQRLAALYNNNNPDALTFDASPGYLFYSSLVPRRILCVLPWVKLVVLLQEPMDRLYQQFQAAVQNHQWKGTLEEWIQRDWDHLEQNGLFAPNIRRVDEDMAWYQYAHTTVGEGGGIGRSLYHYQLRHWFQAMQAAGKNPAEDVLVVWTEEWKKDPTREWERIRSFLGLSPSSKPIPEPKLFPTKFDKSTVSDKTRKKLQKLFDASNSNLRKLLRRYGVDAGKETWT